MSIRTIRRFCVDWCMNGQAPEVRLCTSPECAFYPLRFGKGSAKLDTTPFQAIHAKCVDCSDGIGKVRGCPHSECVLHPFRMGKRLPEEAQWRRLSDSDPGNDAKHHSATERKKSA